MEGGEAGPQRRACGARVLEKNRSICLKISNLEDKITEL